MIIKMKIKDILKDEKLIEASGINPWVVSEGLADREEWHEVEVKNVSV